MHPPINVLVNFNDFIEKYIKLQNIQLEALPKNVIPLIPISNISKHSQSIDINCQLPQLFVS